ncbi:MAG TPA: hypothetical protein VJV23_06350 [Candidatus Polarisedimenticolia bacterium]|nr:hypothetical protein [Candidatus Polarisedimenticolia bacterium]
MLIGARRGLTAGALGVADQVLLSVANLAVGLALAREMEPAAFGIYVVAFAVSLMAASVPISLITEPLVILGSPRTPEEQRPYFAALLRLQLAVSLVLAVLIGLGAAAAWLAWGDASLLGPALAAVAAATVPLQFQTFLRAVLFATLRPGAVLVNDLLLSVLRIAALAGLILAGRLTLPAVFLSAGAAGVAATAAGLAACRGWAGSAPASLRATAREHWGYGRWLLATSGAYWCSGQAPALLASSILSPVAAAILKACQYLVSPLNVAFNGLDGVLAPRGARLNAARDEAAASRFFRRIAAGFGAAVLLYAAVLLPFAERILDGIYKGRYSGQAAVVAILLAEVFLGGIARGHVLKMKVLSRTRLVFLSYLAGASAGLAALIVLAPLYGVTGAAAAAPVSSGVLLVCLLMARSAPRRERAPSVHPAAVPES